MAAGGFTFFVFVALASFCLADFLVYDISVYVNASDNFTLGDANSYKVVVKSNESVPFDVNVTIVREIFNGSDVVYRKEGYYSFRRQVTKTFQWTPKFAGNYMICANITSVSVNDSSFLDNRMCREVYVPEVFSEGEEEEGNSTEEGNVSTPDDNWTGVFGCDLEVVVGTEKFMYDSGEGLKIKVYVVDLNYSGIEHNFTLRYWIEDLFGNVVRAPYENTYDIDDAETRSYNPKAVDIPDSEAYLVKAEIVDAGCNDSNEGNDFNETMILVKGASAEEGEGVRGESMIDITKVSPEKTTFGDIISVSVDVHRGDTSKYSLSVWMERPSDGFDVSEKSTVHLKNKNMEYSLKIPVVIKSNCNERYKDGDYEVIVEGLGVRETKMIVLSGLSSSLCKTETVTRYKYKVKKETKKKDVKEDSETEKVVKVPDVEFVFVSWEENVSLGDEFLTAVDVGNNRDAALNVGVYSYVIDGRSRLSEGLTEEGVWKKSWTGNRKEVLINPGDSVRVNLTNRIMRNVTGNYTLKVKMKGDVDDEIARKINVFEAVVLDDFFGVWCNATDRKTYLFLDNGGPDDKRVVVKSFGSPQSVREVVAGKGDVKQVTYFGRVERFVVVSGDEEFECVVEHEEYDAELEERGRGEYGEDEVVTQGSDIVPMSFVDRVIGRMLMFLGMR